MRVQFAVLIAAIVMTVSSALAAEPVILAGQIVCRLADPGTHSSVTARVSAVDQRICEAISNEDVGEPKMLIAKKNNLWSVFIGKTFLVSVYPLDAKYYNLPADKVAALWAAKFKELFPQAEPAVRFRARQAAGGHLAPPSTKPTAERPAVKVPPEHWGLVDRYMLLLWQARTAPEDQKDSAAQRIQGEILETASLHHFAPPQPTQGEEPGTCNALRQCAGCQADMRAALEVPQDKHDAAKALAWMLSGDQIAIRAIQQTLEYVQRIDQPRFMAERVRISWTLWGRLHGRAKALLESQESAEGG